MTPDSDGPDPKDVRPSMAGSSEAASLLRRLRPGADLPPGAPAVVGIPLRGRGEEGGIVAPGPRALRKALRGFTTYPGAGGEDLRAAGPVFDVGDLGLATEGIAGEGDGDAAGPEALKRIFDAASLLLRKGARPIFLGGAHALAEPVLQALGRSDAVEDPAVVVLDAHLDLHEREDSRSLGRGTPFTAAIRSGHLDPRRVAVLGVRPFAASRMLTRWLRESGVRLLMVDDLGRADIPRRVAELLDTIGLDADGLYLSLDLDVVDSAHAPGTAEPAPGGLDSRELLALVRSLGRALPLVGADISGLAPERDDGAGGTAKLAALSLLEILGAMAFHGSPGGVREETEEADGSARRPRRRPEEGGGSR